MEKNMSEIDEVQQLRDVMKDFRNAFLITTNDLGEMHARPMAIADVDDSGTVYFATSSKSPKMVELEADCYALATFQAGAKFAAVGGVIEVKKDRELIDRLWSDSWKVWFPEGKNDPDLCILKIEPRHGEYWDASGLKGLKVAYESVKALMKKRQPEADIRDHGKVELGS